MQNFKAYFCKKRSINLTERKDQIQYLVLTITVLKFNLMNTSKLINHERYGT